MITLFEKIVAEGINHFNHESDLYVPVNDKTREILMEFPDQPVSIFYSNIDNRKWFSCDFAFDPF